MNYSGRNIYLLYIIKTAKWFMLVMPIIVLFYKSNNLNMQEIMTIQGFYSISIVALEIPSGYLADVWGRKKTIVLGAFLGFAGYLVYCFTDSFVGFMCAEMILGFGQSFISGADSAILYDTLVSQNNENKYTLYEGRVTSLGNIAEALAGIIGGLIAAISLRMPFYFQAGVAFMAIPASIFLIEPKMNRKVLAGGMKEFLMIIKLSLWTDKKLQTNIIFSSIIGACTLTMAWFVQPYFGLIKLPVEYYGVLWTFLNLTVGVFSLLLFKIQKRISDRNLILIITFGLPLLYIFPAIYPGFISLAFLFLFYIIRGIATPLLKDLINKITSSEIRATVLSVRNFVIRLIFAVTGPFAGWISDTYSLTTALIYSGCFFLVFSGFMMFRLFKQEK